MMAAQRLARLTTSPGMAGVKGVSVVARAPPGPECNVVPHAAMPNPPSKFGLGDPPRLRAALFLQLDEPPVPSPPASVMSSFTVTDVGITPVSVLAVK